MNLHTFATVYTQYNDCKQWTVDTHAHTHTHTHTPQTMDSGHTHIHTHTPQTMDSGHTHAHTHTHLKQWTVDTRVRTHTHTHTHIHTSIVPMILCLILKPLHTSKEFPLHVRALLSLYLHVHVSIKTWYIIIQYYTVPCTYLI